MYEETSAGLGRRRRNLLRMLRLVRNRYRLVRWCQHRPALIVTSEAVLPLDSSSSAPILDFLERIEVSSRQAFLFDPVSAAMIYSRRNSTLFSRPRDTDRHLTTLRCRKDDNGSGEMRDDRRKIEAKGTKCCFPGFKGQRSVSRSARSPPSGQTATCRSLQIRRSTEVSHGSFLCTSN